MASAHGSSVLHYLDQTFPTFDSVVAGLEAESERLSETEAVQRREQHEKKQRTDAQLAAVKERLGQLTAEDIANDTSKLHSVLELLPEEFRGPVFAQGSEIDEVAALRNVIEASKQAITFEKELTRLEKASGSDAAAKYYYTQLPLIQKMLSGHENTDPLPRRIVDETLKMIVEKRQELQNTVHGALRNALKQAQWPSHSPTSDGFKSLLATSLRLEENTPVLETFAVLTEDLDLRIKYNFESNRETFRVDKPEWLLDYFFKLVDPHVPWLTSTVQPVLVDITPTRLALNEFVSGLLPSVFRAIKLYFESANTSVSLLSNLVGSVTSFDASLRDQYYYVPADVDHHSAEGSDWIGLASTILETHPDWLEKWIAAEKTEVLESTSAIMEAENAWVIDWDAVEPQYTRPTVSALNLRQLFEKMTEKHRDLKVKDFQLRFLTEIQLEAVEKYYRALTETVALFKSMQSSLGRAVGSASAQQIKKMSSMAGIERLGALFASAAYLIVFLDAESHTTVYSSLFSRDEADKDELIFQELLQSLKEVKHTCVDTIVQAVVKQFHQSMKSFVLLDWKIHSNQVNQTSSEIISPETKMAAILGFFNRLCSQVDYVSIINPISSSVADYIWNNVIQANSFTLAGGAQLLADIDYLWKGAGLAPVPAFRRIRNSAMILAGEEAELDAADRKGVDRRKLVVQ